MGAGSYLGDDSWNETGSRGHGKEKERGKVILGTFLRPPSQAVATQLCRRRAVTHHLLPHPPPVGEGLALWLVTSPNLRVAPAMSVLQPLPPHTVKKPPGQKQKDSGCLLEVSVSPQETRAVHCNDS